MARLRDAMQSVYVMEAPTGESKIGIAENARQRWNSLRFCIPRGEVRLLFVSEPSLYAWFFEKKAHEALNDKRLNGEWFDIAADEAIRLVESIISQGYEETSIEPQTKPDRVRKPNAREIKILERLNTGEPVKSIADEVGVTTTRIYQIAAKNGVKTPRIICRTQGSNKSLVKLLTKIGTRRKRDIAKIARRLANARPRAPKNPPIVLTATAANRRGIAIRLLAVLGYKLVMHGSIANKNPYQIVDSAGNAVAPRMELSGIELWIERAQAHQCASDFSIVSNLDGFGQRAMSAHASPHQRRGRVYSWKESRELKVFNGASD